MDNKYASRAGEKLHYALDYFNLKVNKKICADFGCSTGGFTDCLLQNNAKKVYAIDTGYGILDWKLRNDSRVVVMERTNALHVNLPELVDFISVDVSWTRQKLIVPKALLHLKKNGDLVSLLKPHYEAEKRWLTKGKLDEKFINEVIKKVNDDLAQLNINIKQIIESPIVGGKGSNKEYLLWIKNNFTI
jgi:23S rRNA (cytidine1920-2'-O)/16S rRNA (cytidine1409-2'-O)-methyltransferase